MISAFDIRLSRWYLRFPTALNVYFAICASKTLQKSSATQKISVTLSSVIIAKFFCFIVFFHYKVTKNFADYQIFNELYFIELTLFNKQNTSLSSFCSLADKITLDHNT